MRLAQWQCCGVGAERGTHGIPGQSAEVRGLRGGFHFHRRRTDLLPRQAIQEPTQAVQDLQTETRPRSGSAEPLYQAGDRCGLFGMREGNCPPIPAHPRQASVLPGVFRPTKEDIRRICLRVSFPCLALCSILRRIQGGGFREGKLSDRLSNTHSAEFCYGLPVPGRRTRDSRLGLPLLAVLVSHQQRFNLPQQVAGIHGLHQQ